MKKTDALNVKMKTPEIGDLALTRTPASRRRGPGLLPRHGTSFALALLCLTSVLFLSLPASADAATPSLGHLHFSERVVPQVGSPLTAKFTLFHASRCLLTWTVGNRALKREPFACGEAGDWKTGQIIVPPNKSVYPRTVWLRIVAAGARSVTREISIGQLGYRLPVPEIAECEQSEECDYGPVLETYHSFGNETPVNLGDCTFAAAANLEQIKYRIEPNPTLLGVQFAEAGGGESGLTQAALWKYWEKPEGIEGYRLVSHQSYKLQAEDVRALVEQEKAVLVALEFIEGDYLGDEEVGAGDHEAVIDGFTPTGPLLVTWGKTVQMTWEQWEDEATGMWTVQAVEN